MLKKNYCLFDDCLPNAFFNRYNELCLQNPHRAIFSVNNFRNLQRTYCQRL